MKPWPGGSRGLSGPRPPRHMAWVPAAAAPAGAVAAAGSRRVQSLSPMTPTVRVRCVPATCMQDASTVSCIVSGGEKGRGGRGRQDRRGAPEGQSQCNVRATCLQLVQGRGRITRVTEGPQGNKRRRGERRGGEDARHSARTGGGSRRGHETYPRGWVRARRGKARAVGAPHSVVYRAQGREGTRREAKGRKSHEGQATRKGSGGGYRGQREGWCATCRASCAPCL